MSISDTKTKKEGNLNDYQRLYLHCCTDVHRRRPALPGEEPEVEDVEIGDEEVPLADIPDEEVPLVAKTGDSNHMTAGFGGMLAALAGMFMLRRKKEQ